MEQKRKIGEVTVQVRPCISIDDQSAARCLRLLEMYLTDHPDLTVQCSWKDYYPTGRTMEMQFVKLHREVEHGPV